MTALITFTNIKNKIIHKYTISDLQNSTYHKYFKGNDRDINKYILEKGLYYLKLEIPYLQITEYTFYDNIIPSNTFIILKSKISYNHPYIIYANHYSNTIKIFLTFGKDNKLGQIQLDDFEKIFNSSYKNELTLNEYYALYLMFLDSIHTRKQDMIANDRFSLVKCSNIKQCIIVTRKIKKNKKISKFEINKQVYDKELYYQKKAIEVLEKFFDMLDKGLFEEAYYFLKIEKVRKGKHKGKIATKTKYFGKQRLDTFFKSNKRLIGHLQIFIDLYQFLHICISRINNN